MQKKINSNIVLDGNDWQVNYFITNEQFLEAKKPRRIFNMNEFSGETLGVYKKDYVPSGWMECTVPGGVHTALLENKVIQDPYYGRNMEHIDWIEKYCWWFRKEFEVPAICEKHNTLIEFKGVDYEAVFYFNGIKIGTHADAFMPAVFDISKHIIPGEKNLLCVQFMPPPEASPNHRKKKCADFAKFHRCQMSWGWDWSRRLIPIGLWDSVSIKSYDKALVQDVFVSTEKRKNDVYQIKCQLELNSLIKDELHVEFKVSGHNLQGKDNFFSFTESLKKGLNNIEFLMDYDSPELWYPNGYGKQNLYKLDFVIKSSKGEIISSESRVFAFREIKMLKNPNASENSYPLIFSVNGKRIFARGANWVPSDLIFGRSGKNLYERLVSLAQEANFNMFRVWGGGIIEKDDFYSLCDEKGILVWQEFPHACSNYPKDKKYIAQKKLEAESIIKRLRNHPCIALWCGGNETDYYGESMKSPLLTMYHNLIERLHSDIDYHFSSPDRSRDGEHHHGPWNYESHSFYNEHFRLFASEIGCNGMGELESVKKFIPEKELYPFGQSYTYHFALFNGYKSLAKPVEYFKPENLQEYLWASQTAQADTLRYIMSHYRRNAWKSSGCFIWQFNESWPTFAWSIVDYYTRPKMAYYWLKRACADISVSVKDESWIMQDEKFKTELFITNDSGKPIEDVEVNAELISMSGVQTVNKKFSLKKVPCDGASLRIGIIEKNLASKNCDTFILFLSVEYHGRIIEDAFIYAKTDFSRIFRSRKLKPLLEVVRKNNTEIDVKISNREKSPACGVRIELDADNQTGIYYSDNYFFIKPGAEKSISIKVTDLQEKTGIILTGWNCETINIKL